MENKKLVEFFIDTDSETESCTSSEGNGKEKDFLPLIERGPPPLAEESDSEMEYEEPVRLTSPPPGVDFREANEFKLCDEGASRSNTSSPIDVLQHQSSDEHITFDYPTYPLEQETQVAEETALQASKPSYEKQASVSPPRQCICGSSSPGLSTMVECHSCHALFHGDCVGISRQKALLLKRFYCMVCMDKDPTLANEFETKGPMAAERGGGEEFKVRGRELDEDGGGAPQRGGRKRQYKSKKGSRTCGSCTACLNLVDCRRCRFCKDLPKYGGPGKIRQKCLARQCLRRSKILYTEESLLAGAPVLQEDMAAELRALGIAIPQLDDPSFFVEEPREEDGMEIGPVEGAKESQTSHDNYSRPPPLKKKQPTGKRGRKPGGVGKGKQRPKPATKIRPEVEDIIKNASRRKRRAVERLGGLGSLSREDFYSPTHCLGPGCVYEARPNSKYCSEECGIQLAIGRIRKFLPASRLRQGTETPLATVWNEDKIRELEQEQKSIKQRMEELDQQSDAIDDHLIKINSLDPTEEEDTFEADSEDLTVHCPTCSQPVPLKKAMVHMERCYNKLEGVVSFGSIVKNEGTNIFCDKYDPTQKTYCKRLRVLCPEHTKEPKIGPKVICGCPLDPLFPATNKTCDDFCEQPRKSCLRHYCWIKLRKAEIDQQKLNLFLKLEEVGEQTRLNQWQKSQRSSLLATMLHHTINHSSSSSWNGIGTAEQECKSRNKTDCSNLWDSDL